MSDFAKIGSCAICGGNELIFPDDKYPYFKCTKCEQWMVVTIFEYWEVEYIIQKLRMIEKIKLGDIRWDKK